jgi:hypothetical protein
MKINLHNNEYKDRLKKNLAASTILSKNDTLKSNEESNNQFLLVVVCPEFFRSRSLTFFKKAIEIGKIVKPTTITYFGDGLCRIDQ